MTKIDEHSVVPQVDDAARRRLASALDKHVAVVRHQTGLAMDLAVADDLHLSAQYEEVLYRVVQEALSNVVKHARARHV